MWPSFFPLEQRGTGLEVDWVLQAWLRDGDGFVTWVGDLCWELGRESVFLLVLLDLSAVPSAINYGILSGLSLWNGTWRHCFTMDLVLPQDEN